MKISFKKITLVFGIGLIALYFGYNYVITIGARDIDNETPEYNLAPTALLNDYVKDAAASNKKYLNKTIAIQGTITANDGNAVTVDNVVFCQFTSTQPVKEQELVLIKGRVTGYDDLFGQVKLDQCSIIKQ